MIAFLDYGAGNVRSVINAIENLGEKVRIVTCAEDILSADKLVFPGVGALHVGVGVQDGFVIGQRDGALLLAEGCGRAGAHLGDAHQRLHRARGAQLGQATRPRGLVLVPNRPSAIRPVRGRQRRPSAAKFAFPSGL